MVGCDGQCMVRVIIAMVAAWSMVALWYEDLTMSWSDHVTTIRTQQLWSFHGLTMVGCDGQCMVRVIIAMVAAWSMVALWYEDLTMSWSDHGTTIRARQLWSSHGLTMVGCDGQYMVRIIIAMVTAWSMVALWYEDLTMSWSDHAATMSM